MNIKMEEWFSECDKIFKGDGYEFSIVNGFKITHYLEDSTYSILDVRTNDFYSSVTKSDLELINKFGFVDGTRVISYKRNLARVSKYKNLIEDLFKKRKISKSSLKEDPRFYSKQIKNYTIKIHKYNDLLHFYESKVDQFKPKFNILTKQNHE